MIDDPDHEAGASARLIDLHRRLAAAVPCLPETPQVRSQFEALSLHEVMIAYINYQDRFVPPRPREVSFADAFWTPAAQHDIAGVFEIVREIEAAGDLARRLSPKLSKAGFAPRNPNSWADKDFALNAFDVHHLHLGKVDSRGRWSRADALLFLTFERHRARLLMVGTHKSFFDGTMESAVARDRASTGNTVRAITALPYGEQQRRLAWRGVSTMADVDGVTVPMAMIMSSGHRMRSRLLADRAMDMIEAIEPMIGVEGFALNTFGNNAGRLSNSPYFEWDMQHLDLCLIDVNSGLAGRFLAGDR